jgi:hypothetical protein
VQVSFDPRAEVGPAVGDTTTFTTSIDGIEVRAGQGEVVEIDGASVWVRVSQGRPALGHQAVISATGKPLVPEARDPGARAAIPDAPTPPPALRLVPHRLEGVGQLWLPPALHPRIESPGPYWKVVAEAGGRSAGQLRVNIERHLNPGGDRTPILETREAYAFAEALRYSSGPFQRKGGEYVSDPATRWTNRPLRAPSGCLSQSHDSGMKDRRRAVRLWAVTCFARDPTIFLDFEFVAHHAELDARADATVEWIVRSFQEDQ